jgi:hypothetical protein
MRIDGTLEDVLRELGLGAGTSGFQQSTSTSTSTGVLKYQQDHEVPAFAGATGEIRTPGLRFTKP